MVTQLQIHYCIEYLFGYLTELSESMDMFYIYTIKFDSLECPQSFITAIWKVNFFFFCNYFEFDKSKMWLAQHMYRSVYSQFTFLPSHKCFLISLSAFKLNNDLESDNFVTYLALPKLLNFLRAKVSTTQHCFWQLIQKLISLLNCCRKFQWC